MPILLCLVNCKMPWVIFDIYYFTNRNILNMLVIFFFHFLILLRLIGWAWNSVSFFINSSWLGYTTRQHRIGSSLVQASASQWISYKPLPEPMVPYCQPYAHGQGTTQRREWILDELRNKFCTIFATDCWQRTRRHDECVHKMTNIIHNNRFVKPYIIHNIAWCTKILDTSLQDRGYCQNV